MIELHTWGTPNGKKVSIALEELGLAYEVHKVDIGKGDQQKPEFLKISPNGRIPAIIDRDNGLQLFESGAILIYLAEKTGQLLPTAIDKRAEVISWLMWQMGGVGPMFGQLNHFKKFAPEQIPYAIERYTKETERLRRVLETRLEGREYVCGAYSIADIALYPWLAIYKFQELTLDGLPNVSRWMDAMKSRPAVAKGMAVP